MSNVAWSAEGERRLRERILLLQVLFWLSFVAGVAFVAVGLATRYRLLIIGGFVWILAAFQLHALVKAWAELGSEEMVYGGHRVPGSGMLANKPRDTSRLTRWRRWDPSEGLGPLGFTCSCASPHDWSEMKWIPNVVEYEEKDSGIGSNLDAGVGDAAGPGPASPAGRADDVRAQLSDRSQPESSPSGEAHAIDPAGGRWVLICQCGVGHYMLSAPPSANPDRMEPQ